MIDFCIAPYIMLQQLKKPDNQGSNFESLISSIKEAIDVEIVALFLNKVIKLRKEESFNH